MERRHRSRHVVVGSGAGGAVTAATLAEAGEEVLVLEEGPSVEHGRYPQFSMEQVRHQYRDGGMSAMFGNYLLNYAEGCCVGGSTEVNSGLYHLPDAKLLDAWSRDFAIRDLTPAAIAALAPGIEEAVGLEPPGREPADGASQRLKAGSDALGWDCREVPRWAHREPSGRMVWHGMSSTFIPRATSAGARLLPGTRVERIELDGFRAGGVVAREPDGSPFLVEAEHVWACGGAVGSAALLGRSGIRGLPGRLAAHPTVKAIALFPESLGAPTDVSPFQVKEFAPRVTLGGSARTPSQVAMALAGSLPEASAFVEEPERAAVYYAALSPAGNRGRVALAPGGRGGPVPLLWVTREDRRELASGLRRLCHLLLAAGAQEVRTTIPGFGAIRSEQDVSRLPGLLPLSAGLMTVHTFSSLPMGELPGACAVDSFGNLRGYAGVHVNDASIIPSAPGINPQGTVMALAMRNALAHLSGTREAVGR